MKALADVAKALSEPNRVRIVAILRLSELCVCEICDALEISQSTLSSHLHILRGPGLVSTRKQGKWVYYALEEKYSDFLNSFFDLQRPAEDQRMKRDIDRTKRRLKMREDGCCLRGFNQLDPKGGESRK